MFMPREYANKSSKDLLKASLRVSWRNFRNRWLFSDHELQLGNQVYYELPVRIQCFAKRRAPLAQLCFGLGQKWTQEALESPCQGRVGNVAFVLVELARREKAPRRNKQLVQLVHHGGFTDARITGHEHELWPTVRHHPVEGCEQCVNLAFATIQLFGNHQPVWNVMLARREFVDVVSRLPLVETTSKITLQSDCCLVPVLSGFGEQLHDDCRKHPRNALQLRVGWCGLPCDMAVHPVHRIRSDEGESPGQHFVQRDA